jgi:short-subunit dehydrogenase
VLKSGDRIHRPKHVVITGASSGLGAAIARIYGMEVQRLSLIARDRFKLDWVASDCRASGAEVDVYSVDVCDAAAVATIICECDDKQPVDVIVANAGIGGGASLAPSSGESGQLAREILSTNTLGIINTVTPLLPRMVFRKRGDIAIVSSLAALIDLPFCPAYCASKAAARSYGLALRRLLAPSGVTVSVICPGFVQTPMSASLSIRLPFAWTAERAARYVIPRLKRGQAEILFPWPLVLAVRTLGVMPTPIADFILRRSAKFPA